MTHRRHNLSCVKDIGGRLCCSHTGLPVVVSAPSGKVFEERPAGPKKVDPRPSPTQAETLRRMSEGDLPLARHPGGFWTLKGEPSPDAVKLPYPNRAWYIDIQTIRSMERKGLVARTNEWPEEWRDGRRLTAAGREVGLHVRTPPPQGTY